MKFQRHQPRSRRGWSLIELLVVIAIITILLGILINTASESKAPEEQTKITLRAAIAAEDEYEVQTDQVINHDTTTGPIDWNRARKKNAPGASGSGVPNDNIERLVWAAYQTTASRTIIAGVPKDAIKDADGDGFLELLDGWGNKIKYMAFNDRDHASYDNSLPQRGTQDIAKHAQPFCSSPGKDGKWGNVNANGFANADAEDNMHSFDLE